MNSASTAQSSGELLPAWICRRLGIAMFLFFTFLFFLVKGLLPLTAPAIFYLFA